MVVDFIYDETQRKRWARMAAKGDTSLDLHKEASTKSDEMMDLSKSKMKLVAKAAGLKQESPGSSSGRGTGDHPAGHMQAAESALAKQTELAQSVQRQVERALSSLSDKKVSMSDSPDRHFESRGHDSKKRQTNNQWQPQGTNKSQKCGKGGGKWK